MAKGREDGEDRSGRRLRVAVKGSMWMADEKWRGTGRWTGKDRKKEWFRKEEVEGRRRKNERKREEKWKDTSVKGGKESGRGTEW